MKGKKRSIGQKVFSILILMGLVFIVIVVSNVRALNQIEINNNEITTFMELDDAKGDLAVSFQQAQLYANLSYFKQGTDELDTVRGKLGIAIDDMNANIDAILECVEKIGNDEITAGAQDWAEKVDDFIAHCVTIQELVNADQFEEAKPLIDNQVTVKTPAQEAEDALDVLLLAEQERIETTSSSKIIQTNWFNTVSVVIFCLVIIAAVVVVLKTIARPAQRSGKMLDEIILKLENNEGDLTERIPVRSKDEIGRMSVGINKFLEQLQTIMQKLKSEAENMMVSAEKVGKEIVDSNESAANVSATMEQMSAGMEEISATVSQMASGSTDVLTAIQEMMKDVNEGMSLVTEIKERAQEMHTFTLDGKKSTNETMLEIQETLKTAMEESRSVEQINELTGDILSIASQTNLLALNASIEAARAGEAGKGFAVVADEIRNLADSSRDTANNIQTISNEVTNAVQRLAANAEEMLRFIDEKVMSDYDDFVGVVEKYEKDAESVNDIITDFSKKADEIENTMEGMNTGLNDIAIAVDESARGVTMVAESTVELVSAMEKIQAETQANQEISSTLSEEVNRFKKV